MSQLHSTVRHGRTLTLWLSLAALAGCAEERAPQAPTVTWREHIEPLLARRCVRCHGAEDPSGNYALDSYSAVLAPGSDGVPNAIAGDPTSRVLAIAADPAHEKRLDPSERVMLERWVVTDRLAYFYSLFHPPDWLDPSSDASHGRTLAAARYDFTGCRSCHGADDRGGRYDVSCTTCHVEGPDSCDTCHQQSDPTHTRHIAAGVDCSTCHVVPDNVGAAGHIDDGPPADVTFAGAATARGAQPTFDPTTRSCSDVACHGAGLTGGSVAAPTWGGGATVAECGACHGLPPETPHVAVSECVRCHAETVNEALEIHAPAKHGDGLVQVRSGGIACDSCHSAPGDAGVFVDTLGAEDPAGRPVGAHAAHRDARRLGSPVACDDCHRIPAAVDDPGHLDGTVDIAFGERARARGAVPGWDPESGRCSDVACHGAGLDGRTLSSAVWDQGPDAAECGACHGVPPAQMAAGTHPQLFDCSLCHGETIAADATWVDPTKHTDGIVQARPGSLGCDGCHSGPDSDPPFTDTEGRTSPNEGPVGAHDAHLAGGPFALPMDCATCHVVPDLIDDPGHIDGAPVEVTLAGLAEGGRRPPSWNSETATCADVYCHSIRRAGESPPWTATGAVACGSCHDLPPPTPSHEVALACDACHSSVVDADLRIIDRARHINGQVDFAL